MQQPGYSPDPVIARLRVGARFPLLDLEPASLPESAVLLVRRVADPRRGLFFDEPGAWESAAQGAIDAAYRRAARPALGPVPANAESILFRDRAELLACFLRDWLWGLAGMRWWWRAFFRKMPTEVFSALVMHARYVPGAMAILAGSGEAAAAVRLVTREQAGELVRAVCVEFGMPSVEAVIPDAVLIGAGDGWSERAVAEDADGARAEAQGVAETARWDAGTVREGMRGPAVGRGESGSNVEERRAAMASWRTSDAVALERVTAGIPDDLAPEQALFFVVCMAVGREPALARSAAFVPLLRRYLAMRETRGESVRARLSRTAEPVLAAVKRGVAAEARTVQGVSRDASPVRTKDRIQFDFAPVRAVEVVRRASDAEVCRIAEADAVAAANVAESVTVPSVHEVVDTTRGAELARAEVTMAPTVELEYVTSELCGVFFLVHVLAELERDRETSGWAVIEHVARWLLGTEMVPDPVWRILSELDGRDPEDAPLPCPVWLTEQFPALRERLHGALRTADDLAATLLLRRGRIYATRAHIDVVMPMDSATIAVRMAGLDCNPGWVPELGRVINFHYL